MGYNLGATIDEVITSLREDLVGAQAKIRELEGALEGLLLEVSLSGNADSEDFGWPEAVAAARRALGRED